MPSPFPLFLKKTLAASSPADPDDVLVAKRSLERLGYCERPEWGLGDFTDDRLFEGVRRFQKDNGLTVDGVMNAGGETERSLVPQLAELAQSKSIEVEQVEQALNPSSKPSDDQCDEQLRKDMFVCEGVFRADGAKAGVVCENTAMNRYSACLRGILTHLLPPLVIPQYLRRLFDFE